MHPPFNRAATQTLVCVEHTNSTKAGQQTTGGKWTHEVFGGLNYHQGGIARNKTENVP